MTDQEELPEVERGIHRYRDLDIEWVAYPNGFRPDGQGGQKVNYGLKITGANGEVIHDEPQCADNPGFCLAKAVRIVNAERRRREVEKADALT